jgi:opacity protein-like surface antigen
MTLRLSKAFRRSRALCGGIAIVALCAAPVFAQDPAPQPQPAPQQQPTFTPLPPEPEGMTVTPFIGVGFAGDYQSSPAALGVAVGYGWTERLSFEGEIGVTPNGTIGIPVEFDTSAWNLNANVLYHFLEPSFTPYVTFGIGVLGSNPDIPQELFPEVDGRTTTFAWNVGAGIKTAISERFGLRADLRHFNAADLAPDHWRLYGGVVLRRLLP